MDDIDEAMELKPGGDDMDLYPIDKTDLIDISSLKAEQNLDIADSTIDNLSGESSSTDTVVNTESVSLKNVKQENSTSEELHKKISTNVSSYSSDINLKLKSNAKKASNKKSISIVDITEENDNSDESLNPIEEIVKLGNKSYVIYKCSKCDHRGMRKTHVLIHMKKHIPLGNRKRHQCPTCGAIYLHPYSLKFHMKAEHNQVSEGDKYNPRIFKCTKCDVKKPTKKRLLRHMEVHKPHKERNLYFCTPCNRGFTTLASLKYHYNIKHREDCEQLGFTMKRFTCSKCSCEILGERRYFLHMERHKEKHNLANHTKMHKKSSTSNEASNKNSISIVDIEEDNNKSDSGDENLNGIEETVNFTTGTFTQHKGTVLNVEPIIEEHVNEENNVSEENINASSSDIKQELTKKVRMKMYRCSMCDYKTIQISKLKRHQQVHCTFCYKKFSTTIQLKQHILQHHHFFTHPSTTNTALNSEPISVVHVNEENRNASSSDIKQELFTTDTVVNTESVILDNVKQENHSEENINVSSSDINLKLNTSNEASNKKSISIVDITEKNDNSDENINVIEKIVKLGNSSHVVYKCNKCGFQRTKKTLLLRHVKKHIPLEKRKRHQCPTCGGMYFNLNSFKFHMRVQHSQVSIGDKYDLPIFKCTQCHITKPSKEVLLMHMESHKPPEEKRYQCSVCYNTFTVFASLKYHMNIKHREYCEQIGFAMERFTCSKCSREIVGECRYHRHMERHRQNIKESRTQEAKKKSASKVQKGMHNCSMCDYKTIDKGNLTRHKRVHLALEERHLFACGHCDKKYTAKTSLQQHLIQHRDIHDVELTSLEGNIQEKQVQNSVEQKLELDNHDVELTSSESNNQEEQVQNCIEQKLEIDINDVEFTNAEVNKQEEQVVQIGIKQKLELDTRASGLSSIENNEQEKTLLIKEELDGVLRFKRTTMQKIMFKCYLCDYITTDMSNFGRHKAVHSAPQEQQLLAYAQYDKTYMTRKALTNLNHLGNNYTNSSLTVDTVDLTIEDNEQEVQVQNGIEQKLELDIHDVELTSSEGNIQEEQVQNCIEPKLELDIHDDELTIAGNYKQEEYFQTNILSDDKLELDINTADLTSTETNEQEEQVSNSVEQKLELVVVLNRVDADGVVNNTVDLTSIGTNEQEQVSNSVEQKLELVVVLNRLDCDGVVNNTVDLTSTETNEQEEQVSNSIEQKLELVVVLNRLDCDGVVNSDIQAIELTSTVDNKQEKHVQNREASDSEEFDIQAIELTSTVDNKQEKNVQNREASDSEELTIEVDKRVYECTVCDYQTIIKKNLERHQQVHLTREERKLFPCPLCDKKYTTKPSLNYHLVGNHHAFTEGRTVELTGAEGNEQEEHVQNSVTSHDKLEPRTVELNKRVYKCTMCDYQTIKNKNLKSHQQVHLPREERRWFTCPICDRKYARNPDLRRHLVKYHPDFTTIEVDKRVYECTVCSYQTTVERNLKLHQQVHLPREERQRFTCPLCDKKYTTKNSLKYHLSGNHHDFTEGRTVELTGAEGNEQGEHVQNSVTSRDKLEPEGRTVELTGAEGNEQGEHVQNSVTSHDKLEPRTMEPNKPVYKCTMCDYQTIKNKYLKRHQQVHLPREERRWFTCPICDRQYARNVDLRNHLVKNHPDFTEGRTVEHTGAEGNEQEEHVQNSVTSDDELEPRTMELNQRVYKCTMCDYQTIKNKYLKSHQQVHLPREERRLFPCPLCDKKYTTKISLNYHLDGYHHDFTEGRTVEHTGAEGNEQEEHVQNSITSDDELEPTVELNKRVYKCTMCDYQTIKNKNLKSHQQVHLPREERRWFTCPICDRQYLSNPALRRHLVKYHPDFTESHTVDLTGADDNEREKHFQNSITSDKIIDESISIMNEENAESFIKMEIDDGAPTLDEGMHYDFENPDLSETNVAKSGDIIEIEIDDKAPLLDFNNWELVDEPEKVKIEDIVTLLQPESS